MSAKLTLSKFELMWLFEGAAGKSHLRWDIYEIFVNKVWPQLNADEREFLYTYIKRDTAWLWENKSLGDETPYQYWLQTLARFNPANQYIVTASQGGARPKPSKHIAGMKGTTLTGNSSSPMNTLPKSSIASSRPALTTCAIFATSVCAISDITRTALRLTIANGLSYGLAISAIY